MNDFDHKHVDKVAPTPAHYFIRLLFDKGLMHRVFSQNTDDLFLKAGLDEEQVIHAHGHNACAVCSICGSRDSYDEMMAALRAGEVRFCPRCKHTGKNSPIKPGVVFFNESLPKQFYDEVQ